MTGLIISAVLMAGFVGWCSLRDRGLVDQGRVEREREIVEAAEKVEAGKQERYEKDIIRNKRTVKEIKKTEKRKEKSVKIKELF